MCVTSQTRTVPEPLGTFGPKCTQLLYVPWPTYSQNFVENRSTVLKIFHIYAKICIKLAPPAPVKWALCPNRWARWAQNLIKFSPYPMLLILKTSSKSAEPFLRYLCTNKSYILITCGARCVTSQTGTVPEPLGTFGPKFTQVLSVPLIYLSTKFY